MAGRKGGRTPCANTLRKQILRLGSPTNVFFHRQMYHCRVPLSGPRIVVVCVARLRVNTLWRKGLSLPKGRGTHKKGIHRENGLILPIKKAFGLLHVVKSSQSIRCNAGHVFSIFACLRSYLWLSVDYFLLRWFVVSVYVASGWCERVGCWTPSKDLVWQSQKREEGEERGRI